jgi:hypothetical protein
LDYAPIPLLRNRLFFQANYTAPQVSRGLVAISFPNAKIDEDRVVTATGSYNATASLESSGGG